MIVALSVSTFATKVYAASSTSWLGRRGHGVQPDGTRLGYDGLKILASYNACEID